jgi:hypothetical protein
VVKQLGVTDVTPAAGISVALPRDGGSYSMSRPASSTLNTDSKPALKNPLRASTMSLLVPTAAISEEPESPSCTTGQAVLLVAGYR